MTDLEKAARMALEALKMCRGVIRHNIERLVPIESPNPWFSQDVDRAIIAAEKALAQPQDEWLTGCPECGMDGECGCDKKSEPAQQQQQEPKLSEIFCVVDFADKLLYVSVLRRRNDDVAELLHFEQIALPAQQEPFKPDWVNYRQGVEDGRAEASEMLAKQEPVAFADGTFNHAPLPFGTPLYAAPQPSKPWVGLTDEELVEVLEDSDEGQESSEYAIAACRAIEAKLKEKNA